MSTCPTTSADEWKLEHDAKKAAEEKAAAAAAAAAGGTPGAAAGGDQEMADAATAAAAAAAAGAAAAGGAAGRDKEKEKKRKSPEELSCDILVHFAHTTRAFDQVGAAPLTSNVATLSGFDQTRKLRPCWRAWSLPHSSQAAALAVD